MFYNQRNQLYMYYQLKGQIKYINIFAAKHLKKPIPQCQACFKDSWILRVDGFNTEYLQNHST